MRHVAVATAAALVAAPLVVVQVARAEASAGSTVLSSTPIAFSSTDGDILAISKVRGAATPRIAIGGNFDHVITKSGTSVAAKNFAILDAHTGKVLYAGNANSYVRAIASYKGKTFIGGDFTKFGGKSRNRLAAITKTGKVAKWNPKSNKRVAALAASKSGVYIGGYLGKVRKVTRGAATTRWTRKTTGGSVQALLLSGGKLYAGGLFETYAGVSRHGLAKIKLSNGAVIKSFNANLRADTGTGIYGAYDGENVLAMSKGTSSATIALAIGGHAPAGLSSNETIMVNASTGARVWRIGLPGDGQAVSPVGSTLFTGYHRNTSNGSVPYPYFGAQVEGSDGTLTSWDPKITGTQGNEDGGNNGVQASYAYKSAKLLYVAGAFTKWNNTRTHQSLVVFTWS